MLPTGVAPSSAIFYALTAQHIGNLLAPPMGVAPTSAIFYALTAQHIGNLLAPRGGTGVVAGRVDPINTTSLSLGRAAGGAGAVADEDDPSTIASSSLGGAAGGAGAVADEVTAVAREVMTVAIQRLSGPTFTIHDVSIDMKVRDLKKLVAEKMGFVPRFLVLHEEKLEMDKSLREQGCVPGDIKSINAVSILGAPCTNCNPDNTFANHCIHE